MHRKFDFVTKEDVYIAMPPSSIELGIVNDSRWYKPNQEDEFWERFESAPQPFKLNTAKMDSEMNQNQQASYVERVRKHKGLMTNRKFYDKVRKINEALISTPDKKYNTE